MRATRIEKGENDDDGRDNEISPAKEEEGGDCANVEDI
jgi:hypothetical protein